MERDPYKINKLDLEGRLKVKNRLLFIFKNLDNVYFSEGSEGSEAIYQQRIVAFLKAVRNSRLFLLLTNTKRKSYDNQQRFY